MPLTMNDDDNDDGFDNRKGNGPRAFVSGAKPGDKMQPAHTDRILLIADC